ncbi:UvrD-helicase domain-containing protein [Pseudomonas corrugata]|uniref:UvrD-helicase domain-containing protein n=1 Tax=Pseudomonas corrugata TaxID=47879 RepID=UPI0028C4BFDD|nr:UvrD-helicase domain-containing protein [Pseudomonas corrugata]MDU9034250.1 UvrD-helicase domain-containing protein [Pseudomonas corrugata]
MIDATDLAALLDLTPDLNFNDHERRAVLLENQSRDINAAPGSGKTTVLAAKLLMLSRKWSSSRAGVCVLSHTNVARDEIQHRLGASHDGSRLLTHPHFIGTIHAMVNQFLALPYLRSNGMTVDVIDNDIFARRALALAEANYGLKLYMQKNASVGPMLGGLVYKGASLDLASEFGSLPKPSAKTYPTIVGIKQKLVAEGVFRHADMFAYAECLLTQFPKVRAQLSRRFPVVFIDEMQDTSWEQERLLQLMFDDTVIIQRFGDINQRILGSSEGAEHLTFPRGDVLPISSSKRFGPHIAQSVSRTQLAGSAVTGESEDRHASMLIVYSTGRVQDVISTFGGHVLDRFSDADLTNAKVKALCARKQGDAATQTAGRTLLDYWPASTGDQSPGLKLVRFWALLSGSKPAVNASFSSRFEEIRRALFLVLRAANAEIVEGLKADHQLIRKLRDADMDVSAFRLLMRDLCMENVVEADEEWRVRVVNTLYAGLRSLLPDHMTRQIFTELPVFHHPAKVATQGPHRSICTIEKSGRSLNIHIGTLASMKGETHLATLVMESLGHPSRRFDLELALPIIAGIGTRAKKTPESQLSQFRNLYVGMSRPTSFLCLAVNAERVSDECKTALAEQGWTISHLL